MVLHVLDPLHGVGEELARISIAGMPGTNSGYGISPDGTRIAIVYGAVHPVIRIIDLKNNTGRNLELSLNAGIQALAWNSDASGFFVSAVSPTGNNILNWTRRVDPHFS